MAKISIKYPLIYIVINKTAILIDLHTTFYAIFITKITDYVKIIQICFYYIMLFAKCIF